MNVNTEDYTDKSFIVFGEDIEYLTDLLTQLGGKQNNRLKARTVFDGGFAWIFPKFKEGAVKSAIKTVSKNTNRMKREESITKKMNWAEMSTPTLQEKLEELLESVKEVKSILESRMESDVPDFTMNCVSSLSRSSSSSSSSSTRTSLLRPPVSSTRTSLLRPPVSSTRSSFIRP